ncbi:hypothetical protein HT136_05540 [Novosphingobium profundi]|uniref:allene oxide cyclase barrel-like domain-containing protein n=1 Tax=Novosphingobium profundi TaxID=1774954 RepID=UPI001BD9A74E|nr:hypothetical protein [Novosphingobium profundi]MBT0667827.1 hypothetical protein [Novosphingobium profundi]
MNLKSFAIQVALAASLVVPAQTIAASPQVLTFSVVELSTGETTVDLGAKGPSAGDMLTFNNPLLDGPGGKEIGRMNGFCIRTAVGKGQECTFSDIFADGSVMAHGYFLETGDAAFVASGGTGRYAGLHGEITMDVVDGADPAFRYTFHLSR